MRRAALVAFGLLLATPSQSQQEADFARSRFIIGPTYAAVKSDTDAILTLPSGFLMRLWGIFPRAGYRVEMNRILEEKITCVLQNEDQPSNQMPAVLCRSIRYRDLATELVTRSVAVPDVLSPKR
jgi:hypothetical protein